MEEIEGEPGSEQDGINIEDIEEIKEISAEIERNQSLSERFRQELENYLTELDKKTTADGEALISKPPEFETIVNAMTREDLESKNVKGRAPWYDYLIQDHVNKKMDRDFQGRYHSLFESTSEEQIRRGMAEILMLDRKLWMLSKRAVMLNEETKQLAESVPPTPGSSRTTADRTFITKPKAEESESNHSVAKLMSPPRNENTSKNRPRSALKSGRKLITPRQENEEISDKVDVSKEETEKMNEDQTQRIQSILQMNDDEFEKSFAYFPIEYHEEMQKVDEELIKFGRINRLEVIYPTEEEEIDPSDYLAVQVSEPILILFLDLMIIMQYYL
jgi:hypothetical protein